MDISETQVATHYANNQLLDRILAGLQLSGKDPNKIALEELAPVDEFHIGGRDATQYAVRKLRLSKRHHVLDVGCGLGGATRYMAASAGAKVTGIDLTPDFISTAEALTERAGLASQISYRVASALAMPFAPASFDAALTLHVAMNIADRCGLYNEIARVLKPGARFCVYDIMRTSDADIAFPVPWSETPATNHLTSPKEMCALLREAGFEVLAIEDRTALAQVHFQRRQCAVGKGPDALGIHMVLGENAPAKFANMAANIEAGHIAPVQIIAKRPGTLRASSLMSRFWH